MICFTYLIPEAIYHSSFISEKNMLMKVEGPKNRIWSIELLEGAKEFHGHGGPFMVIGLRMGLSSLKRLDARGWFDLRCRVFLKWRPPDSCVIDGIQYSTGCTMGKHNIEVEERDGITAEFTKAEKSMRFVLAQDVLDKIRKTLASKSENAVKTLMDELISAPDEEIFNIIQFKS